MMTLANLCWFRFQLLFYFSFACLQIFQLVNSQDIDQRVKLTDLHTITLFKDKLTHTRRLTSIPQLRCVGSFWKCQTYSPNVVECHNKGYDGVEVQWECKADLDKSVRLGMMKVVCEGYSFPEDLYVLANSCGLEYTLELTRSNRNYDYYNSNLYETSKLSNFLTLLIMVVIILAVYKTCNKNRELELRREINGTYAHVIDSAGSTQGGTSPAGLAELFASPLNAYHGLAGSTSSTSYLFPPPPPPYGSLVQQSSTTNDAGLTHATTQTASMPATTTTDAVVSVTVPLTETTQNAAAPATVAATTIASSTANGANSVALKPDDTQESTNVTAPLSSPPPSSQTTSWSSFLAGRRAAVSGYLLNRRNTSPRRSDSPPPTYEEIRTLNAPSYSSSRR